MPQVGNKKFPYTPSGIARANAIKKKLMGGSMKQDKMYRPDRDGMKRPALSMPRPKPPARPGMRPAITRPTGGVTPKPSGKRPDPKKRYPRLLPGRGLGKYL